MKNNPEYAADWYLRNRERLLPLHTENARKWRLANPKRYLLSGAKQRGLECTITEKDFEIPSHCPVLGVPLQFGTPYAPSLDRIDNTRGYVPGNVQVISRKANLMKNNASDDELRRFADWVTKIYQPL